MTKLSGWIRKHFMSKSRSKKQSTDRLPFIPSSRRPITPVSFDTPTCLFFQLPYDILTMILTIAFGGRTLHVDIVRREEAWQWRGAVCYWIDSRLPPYWKYIRLSLWNDECLKDVYESRRKFPEYRNLDIMGFLLSCRQAYTKGIDTLYSANCICIPSEPLLLHLPQLIPPNRLVCISSLEIFITAHRTLHENGKPAFNVDHLKPILDNIATYCHNLRSLCLIFLVAD